MSTYREEWAAEVREGLKESGLSYQQVAEKIGCSKAYIGDWIGKKVPKRAMVERWAVAMNRDRTRALIAAGYLERPQSGPDILMEGWDVLAAYFADFEFPRYYRGLSAITPEKARRSLIAQEIYWRERHALPAIDPAHGLFGDRSAYRDFHPAVAPLEMDKDPGE